MMAELGRGKQGSAVMADLRRHGQAGNMLGRKPARGDAMAYDENTAARVRKLLAGQRDVAEKKMMGGLCFMVNNTMCCTVSGRGGMLIRVGPDAHARMLQKPHTSPMEMRGRIMTGFVRVAPDGYQSDAELKEWVKRGLDFVAANTAGRKAAPRKAAAATTRVAAKAKASPRGRARKGLRR
ncbi:TfoX/Sxy family protein [Bradyrhizobium japonicum]|uniref:TfoX/Sxy family protein n=1 Tax=Bradyrhizobium japonicum TaxID=375 RepID=UPI002714B6FA|nr:TfoX/Sxy family protein [Bradyrhizobium japonicum]WLB55320.1 TfoX/Sxy family protein [Bradyrhizobium japonicum]WLB62806.1 TfoX/Sxy family protein [Bradyrhizobium japonicum]